MTASLPATLVAPAKLTLGLRIVGTRSDGYHLIDSEMVSLDLVDTVELTARLAEPARAPAIEVVDSTGRAIDAGPPGQNLIVRALDLVGHDAAVRVTKRIAPGAGLGGGSADAAAVLRWAGFDDLEAAAGLGADVAFCCQGGRARVRGIGEVVEPLEFVERTFTLLTPPFGCATAAVYARWDALGGPADDRHDEFPNDLEAAAQSVEPRLVEFRDRLAAATGRRPRLAGSGSTWFVEGDFPGDDRVVVHTTDRTA